MRNYSPQGFKSSMRILYKTGGGASKEYLEIILKAKLEGVEAWAVVPF